MELTHYELMREHILLMVEGAGDNGVPLKEIVQAAQSRFGTHEAFPAGRLTNYCTYTKVDLEARGLIERVPRSSPQQVRPGSPQTGRSDGHANDE